MVMACAKLMNVTEETVVGCSLIYNSGFWKKVIDKEDFMCSNNEYLNGYVSTILEDFCLDYMSGRIPPNLLVNALEIVSGERNKRTQRLRR